MVKRGILVWVQDDATRRGSESNEVDPVDLAMCRHTLGEYIFVSSSMAWKRTSWVFFSSNLSMFLSKVLVSSSPSRKLGILNMQRNAVQWTNLLMISEDADQNSPHVWSQEREVQHGCATYLQQTRECECKCNVRKKNWKYILLVRIISKIVSSSNPAVPLKLLVQWSRTGTLLLRIQQKGAPETTEKDHGKEKHNHVWIIVGKII
jgi:hypothetical protein